MDGPVPVAIRVSDPHVLFDTVIKQEEVILPDIGACEADERIKPDTSSIKKEICESPDGNEDELENPFQCFACGLDCNSQRELIEHYESEHTDGNDEDCVSLDGATGNMKSEDAEDDPLIGDEAPINIGNGKVQNIGQAIGECNMTSSQDWLHYCPICGFTSIDRQDLTSHMETHVLVQPLTCSNCKYIFSDTYHLKDYVCTNKLERPHSCAHCSFRTEWLQTLKNHCFTHHSNTVISNDSLHSSGGSLMQPIPAFNGTQSGILQPASVFPSIANTMPSSRETSDEPSDGNASASTDEAIHQGQNGYFVVLKNCRSNGQFLGDLTIPANPFILGNEAPPKVSAVPPSNSDVLQHLLVSNSMNEMVGPLLQSPKYRRLVPDRRAKRKAADASTPSPPSLILPKLAPSDNLTLAPNNFPLQNPVTAPNVVHSADAWLPVRNIAPRLPEMILPPNLPTAIPTPPKPVSKDENKPRVRKAKDLANANRKNKRIPCPYCEYVARDTWNLKTHTFTHTRERPFGCPHCAYRASQAAHLRKHLLIHQRIRDGLS